MFDLIVQFVSSAGYAGVALLMFAENVFPPIPSELIMPLAGFAAARGEVWACEGIRGTSCRFAGRGSPGASSGAWQGRATDEQQRMARPAKRPCGPALCVRPAALLTARVAPLPLFAAPRGTSARGRQDAPFIAFTGPYSTYLGN